jgi:hypothetical protein
MTRDPRTETELNRIIQDLRRTMLQIKQQSIDTYLQELTDDAITTLCGKRQNAFNYQKCTSRWCGNRITRGRGTVTKKWKSLPITWKGLSNQTKRKPWTALDAD